MGGGEIPRRGVAGGLSPTGKGMMGTKRRETATGTASATRPHETDGAETSQTRPDPFKNAAAAHCVAGAEKAGRPRPFRRPTMAYQSTVSPITAHVCASRFGGSVESGRVGTRGVVGKVLEGYETR